jgi:hypothetical protein
LENVREFLSRYDVSNKLWGSQESDLRNFEPGKYKSKYFIELNAFEHEDAIKILRKNGWKSEQRKYDMYGNEIYDEDVIILSYIPYKFLD